MKRNVLTILCLISLTLATCGGKATAEPAVTQITPQTLNMPTITPTMNAVTPTTSAPVLYKDIEYKPASDRYPEMDISEERSCNIGGHAVTFKDLGNGTLQVTEDKNTYLVTEQEVKDADTTYRDGWIKLPQSLGNISVGYIDRQWFVDWLDGCPAAVKTPGPP